MNGDIKPVEKYERGGWPSIQRPDSKPPPGWDRSLLVGVNRIYNHSLSPDGASLVYFCNHGHDADLYSISSGGGWPNRLTVRRPAVQYWWEETPAWSPDSQWIAYCQHGRVWVLPSQGGLPV